MEEVWLQFWTGDVMEFVVDVLNIVVMVVEVVDVFKVTANSLEHGSISCLAGNLKSDLNVTT